MSHVLRSAAPRVFLVATAILALSSLLGGCGSVAQWTYPTGHYEESRSPQMGDAVVVVLPFEDARDAGNSNAMALSLIPLVPFGNASYQRAEGGRPYLSLQEYTGNPPEDLAKAAAVELRRQGLVERAFFSYGGGDAEIATHVLRGTLRRFHYEGTLISYGVSFLGVYLWMLGLPMGSSRDTIEVELALVDRRDGREVWRGRIEQTDRITQGLYYGAGRDCDAFARLYEKGLKLAFANIGPHLGAAPAPLPPTLRNELEAERQRTTRE